MSKIKQLEIKGTTYDIQDALIPDTLGTAGQVLKVNSGRTGLEYGDVGGGGGGITEISDPTFRIWGRATGVYRLTYNGSKTIYYSGSSSTTSFILTDIDPLLFVQKDSSTVTSWWVFDKYTDSTYTSALQVRFGATTSSSGTSKLFLLPESAGSSGQYLKSNGSSSAPTWSTPPSSGNTLYQHMIAIEDSYNGYWFTLVLYSSSNIAVISNNDFVSLFGDGQFPVAPPYPDIGNGGILTAAYHTGDGGQVSAIRFDGSGGLENYTGDASNFYDTITEV